MVVTDERGLAWLYAQPEELRAGLAIRIALILAFYLLVTSLIVPRVAVFVWELLWQSFAYRIHKLDLVTVWRNGFVWASELSREAVDVFYDQAAGATLLQHLYLASPDGRGLLYAVIILIGSFAALWHFSKETSDFAYCPSLAKKHIEERVKNLAERREVRIRAGLPPDSP
jgi:hypothetical protein